MEWVYSKRGAPKRVNHAAAVVDEFIYSFGGYTADVNFNDMELKIDVHCLNTKTLTWSLVNYINEDLAPFLRFGHSVVAYGSLIYLFGGQNEETHYDPTLYCFNTRTLSWSQPDITGDIPPGCDGHAACIHGNVMYIFGGFIGSINHYSNELYSIDLDTMGWKMLPKDGEHPFYREFHSMQSTPSGDLIVFGGREYMTSYVENEEQQIETYPNDVYVYEIGKRVWRKAKVSGSVPLGRRSHAAFKYGNAMFVFGGVTHAPPLEDEHLNDLHALDMTSFCWTPVLSRGEKPSARRRMVMVVVGRVAHMFGGTQPEAGTTGAHGTHNLEEQDDCWLLDLDLRLDQQCLVRCSQLSVDLRLLPLELRRRAAFVPRPPAHLKRLRHRARIDRDA